MVFVAGPRQVGKTTLARQILAASKAGVYLSWDNREDRRDCGGDSLQGRYHHYRLHPFTLGELQSRGTPEAPKPGLELQIPTRGSRETLASLMKYGGFPEPFLAQSKRTLRRWQKERLERFFREDVREVEAVRELSSLQILADLLPERVGSPLSLNALREDLEASHRAVTLWMEILERLYHVFRLRPHASAKVRGLRKMPKLYLWEWSPIAEPGPRLENLVAAHLLKLVHLLQDQDGHPADLKYLQDRSGKETDFLIVVGQKPWLAVEVKLASTQIDPALVYLREKLAIPWAYQVVLEGDRDFIQDGVRCLPVHRFLGALV